MISAARALLVSIACSSIILRVVAADATAGPLRFAVLGDTPYFAFEEVRLEQLIPAINAAPLAFVLHVGDIKSGMDRCDDRIYFRRNALFSHLAHPFVLIPGDNDWTDCHRAEDGGHDPAERLAFFRDVFYRGAPATIAGAPIVRQPGRPENMRWTLNGVLFVTLNVTGSHNGFGRTQQSDAEYRERNAANLQWLMESFSTAREVRAQAVVAAMHANLHLERRPGSRGRMGFEDTIRALLREALAYAKPVLLVHGDTHAYRFDRPLDSVPNLTRLETFGSPQVGWVEVTVEPGASTPFWVEPRS